MLFFFRLPSTCISQCCHRCTKIELYKGLIMHTCESVKFFERSRLFFSFNYVFLVENWCQASTKHFFSWGLEQALMKFSFMFPKWLGWYVSFSFFFFLFLLKIKQTPPIYRLRNFWKHLLFVNFGIIPIFLNFINS